MRINQIIYNSLILIKEKLEDKISNEDYDNELSQKLDFVQQWLDEAELTIVIPKHITKEWYRDTYLNSPHWRKKKNAALDYAKRLCQLCNNAWLLDVHHRTYENLGCENVRDLIVLCTTCHDKFHREIK